MSTVSDLSNFTGAWHNLVLSLKVWDPADPDSTQALVNNLESFSAAATPLITANPVVNNTANAIGVQAAINALAADTTAYANAVQNNQPQTNQISALLGMIADASGAVTGVSTLALIPSTAFGNLPGDAALGGIAIASGSLSVLASVAQFQYNQAQNPQSAASILTNTVQKIQSFLNGGTTTASPSTVTFSDGSSFLINPNGNGGGAINFYNAAQAQAANLEYFSSPNGSGAICTVTDPTGNGSISSNGQLLTYTPQSLLNLSFSAAGVALVTAAPVSGTGAPVSFDLSTAGTTATVNGSSLFVGAPGATTSLDAFGNINFTVPTVNGTTATVTVPNGGGDVALTSGANTLNVAPSALSSVTTGSNGALTLGLTTSTDNGIAAALWNPVSGDMTLNIPGANGATSALDLGVAPAGTQLGVSGSVVSVANSAGQALQNVQVNDDGSYSNTIINTGSTVVANYDPFNQLTSSTTTYAPAPGSPYLTGGSSTTIYSNDPDSPWVSQTSAYNGAGQLIGTASVDQSGNATLVAIDPISGQPILTTQLNNQGQVVAQTASNTASYGQLVQAIGDTLASQLVQNVLLPHDLPASIIATGFGAAVVQSAIAAQQGTSVNFAGDFASSVFDVAGGVGGSEVGDLVAKALGIPQEIGSLAGGVTGNLLTQQLVSSAAYQLNLVQSSQDVLTAAGFAAGLGGAGGGVVGSELSSLVLPPSLAGEVTGAVAAAAALSLIALDADPFTAAFEAFSLAFGSDFLGNIVGDVIGGLFGGQPSVGPNATALVQYVNGQLATTYANGDNGGNAGFARSETDAAASTTNSINSSIGGTIINGSSLPIWGLGYFEGQLFATNETTDPNGYSSNYFPTTTAAISDVVFNFLKAEQIQGGNPYMTAMLQVSTATDLPDLVSDLNAARDYSVYMADPSAFLLALALSGNAAQYATWQTELARVEALGLNQFTPDGNGNLIFTGSVANVQALQPALETLAAVGNVSSIQLTTDQGTITLDHATIVAGLNAALTVVGSNDNVTIGSDGTLTMNGSGDVATLANGVSAATSGNTINAASNAEITVTGNNDRVAVGSDNVVYLSGANFSFSSYTGTTVILAGYSNASVYGSTGNVINLSNGGSVNTTGNQINVAAGANVTITGSQNSISLASNDLLTDVSGGNTIAVQASSNYITASADTINLASGVGAVSVVGSYDTLDLVNGASVTFTGGQSSITLAGNNSLTDVSGGNTITVQGSSNYITASSDTINLAASVGGMTVNGTNDTLYLANGASVTTSGNLVSTASDTEIGVTGNNDRIAAGYNNVMFLSGTGFSVSSYTGATVNLAVNSEGSFYGSTGNTFYLTNGDNVSTSSNTINVAAAAFVTVDGSNNDLIAGAGASLNINGTNNAVSGASGGDIAVIGTAASLWGTTFSNYQATDTFDITTRTFTAQTKATFISTGSDSGIVDVSDSGGVFETITIASGNWETFAVESDGKGGVLVVDPPLATASTASTGTTPPLTFIGGSLAAATTQATAQLSASYIWQTYGTHADALTSSNSVPMTSGETDVGAFIQQHMASGDIDLHASLVGSLLTAQAPDALPSPTNSAIPDEPHLPGMMAAWDTHQSYGGNFAASFQTHNQLG